MAVNRVAYPFSQIVPWHGQVRTIKAFGGPVSITAADVTTINNTVQLFTVPKGLTIVGVHIDVTRLDNGGAALTLSIGDATVTNRLLSASTIGQSAESESNVTLPPGVLGFKYPADTDIQMLVAAAAGTPVLGTVTVFIFGFIDA